MKALKLSIMALAISVTGISAYAQTADEVIQKHIDAVGGTKSWDKIKSIKLVGSVSAQGMDIPMTQTIVNDKAMRMDISAMGQNGYVIMTTTKGWQFMPFAGMTEPKEVPAEQVKMSKSQLNYKNSQLVDKSLIKKATFEGKDSINSISCYKLKITDKDGEEMTCYFDAATYYMLRQERKVKVQDEEQEIGVTYSNFKKQPEGVVIPMNVSSPQGDVTYKSVEINKPVDEKIFKPDTK